jgi:hypothetical protein
MRKLILFTIVVFTMMLFSTACATQQNATIIRDGDICAKPIEKVRIPLLFGTRQIKDWSVIDNKTIIINTYSYGKFKATFSMNCTGIPYTETIGFLTHGPYALDEYTTVVLSDGERCYIKELLPYINKDEETNEP